MTPTTRPGAQKSSTVFGYNSVEAVTLSLVVSVAEVSMPTTSSAMDTSIAQNPHRESDVEDMAQREAVAKECADIAVPVLQSGGATANSEDEE